MVLHAFIHVCVYMYATMRPRTHFHIYYKYVL